MCSDLKNEFSDDCSQSSDQVSFGNFTLYIFLLLLQPIRNILDYIRVGYDYYYPTLIHIYVLNPEIRHSTQRSEGILELQPSPLVSLRPVIRFFTYNNMVWSKYWISFVCKRILFFLKLELIFETLLCSMGAQLFFQGLAGIA